MTMMMKKYRERIEAGGTLDIQHPGRYFHMLKSLSPVDLYFIKSERVSDEARDVTAGIWFEPESDFERVRISNGEPYAVTVEFILSGGRAGWTAPPPSTDEYRVALDGLPASAMAYTEVVDLGENWGACVMGVLFGGLASAGATLAIFSGNSYGPPATLTKVCQGQGYNGTAFIAAAGTSAHFSSARPTGRYVVARYANGSTPQSGPSGALELHIHRNVTA